MSAEHEEFIFFQECLTSLNSAWSIIDALGASESHKTVAWAAFRMALIEYAKPYKRSVGVHIKRHLLPPPALSPEDRQLHERIVQLRDTVLAHSDLSVKDAKVYVGQISGKSFPMIISNAMPPLPTLAEVRGLIQLGKPPALPGWQ